MEPGAFFVEKNLLLANLALIKSLSNSLYLLTRFKANTKFKNIKQRALVPSIYSDSWTWWKDFGPKSTTILFFSYYTKLLYKILFCPCKHFFFHHYNCKTLQKGCCRFSLITYYWMYYADRKNKMLVWICCNTHLICAERIKSSLVIAWIHKTSPVIMEQHINLRQEVDQISASEMKSRISTALPSSHCVHVVFNPLRWENLGRGANKIWNLECENKWQVHKSRGVNFHREKNALISEIEVRRYKKDSDFSVSRRRWVWK